MNPIPKIGLDVVVWYLGYKTTSLSLFLVIKLWVAMSAVLSVNKAKIPPEAKFVTAPPIIGTDAAATGETGDR